MAGGNFVLRDYPSFDVSRGACATTVAPDLWFPISPASDAVGADIARGICETCPVARECAKFAATSRATGVWGGLLFENGNVRNFVDPADLSAKAYADQSARVARMFGKA